MSIPSHPAPVRPVAMLRAVEKGKPEVGLDGDERQGGDQERARQVLPLPDVPEPSAAEIARHCLTHLPFRKW